MHYFKYLIIFSFIVTSISCDKTKLTDSYVICNSTDFKDKYSIGDTIPLYACNTSNVLSYGARWTVTSYGELLFENYNLNSYFVVAKDGNHRITLETIEYKKNGNYNSRNKSVRDIVSNSVRSLVVFKKNNLYSNIEVKIRRANESQIISQQYLTAYLSNFQTPGCFSSQANQAVFLNLPFGDYVIEAKYVSGLNQTWSIPITINSDKNDCISIEIN